MKYEKPALIQFAPAMKAIQHLTDKSVPQILDNAQPPQMASAAAYAADE